MAKEHYPDLMLMDTQLPGIDGLTATRHLKKDQDHKDIPAIAPTEYAMPESKEKAFSAGCTDSISNFFNIFNRVSFYLGNIGSETD